MAVTSFALDSAVTGLVAALRAGTGFRAPDEDGIDVPVFDGVIVSADPALACLVVGSNGDPAGTQVGRFTHDWHDLDMTTEERGDIQCAVVVWSGDSDAQAAQRNTAVAVLEAADTVLRSTVSASTVGVTQLMWSLVTSGELFQVGSERGTETRLPFVWTYQAINQVT